MAGVMRSCASGLTANERSRLFGFTTQTKAVGLMRWSHLHEEINPS